MYECGSTFICIAILGEILLEGFLDRSVGGIIQKKLADSRLGLKPGWLILKEIAYQIRVVFGVFQVFKPHGNVFFEFFGIDILNPVDGFDAKSDVSEIWV